jgi:integrase/recombinase XerD
VARRRRRRGHIDITPAVVAQFAAERAAADPPPAATSLARLQSSVRGLHRFLVREGIELRRERSPDPAEDPQRLPKALTIDQIARSWMPPAPRPASPPRPMRSAFATAL